MSNEHTKLQIKNFLDNAIKKAQNPSPRERFKRLRKQKMKKVAKKYGF